MKKLLTSSLAVIALAAGPAFAQISESPQTDDDALLGGSAGAAAGGTVGFVLGGPIGAIVGGFTGAVLGAEAAVPEQTIVYAGNNPVEPVYLDTQLEVGAAVPETVTVYEVEPTPEYGYFYANNRVYIVDNNSREIVYSPGFTIPQDAVSYVEANPTTSVEISGDLAPGAQIDGTVEISTVPDYPRYGYVYVDDRPALVDRDTRTIVWIR